MGADAPLGDLPLNASVRAAASFGARLRGFRVRAGLSQEALAERAGLAVATLKALEGDRRPRPHPDTLARLAAALGLAAADRDALLDSTQAGEAARPHLPDQSAVALPRLPLWLTSFVGREVEVASVRALLDPVQWSTRLLTLVGPGGVGKTRLAVAAAAALGPAYPDGVVFVDLAPLRDARLVPATIARALGVREGGGRSAHDLLLESLRERQVLLVLDNLEHLPGAAPLLAELLQACPRVALLATSRAALRLRAERREVVEPLATPREDLPSLDGVAASPAVRLFVERALAVAPDFVLDSGNAAAVAAVCRRLDGMPLAIELAAARAGVLQPAALLQRLERRLPLLTAGAPDLPERQHTLRATLAWSHDLLDPAARVLFRRLAVFAGGWTLEAVEAVCGDAGLLAADVLDRLQVLVDSSLVRRLDESGDQPRFGMLETMREYAREHLVLSGELERLRAAHAAFYSRLAEPAAAARTIAPWLGARAPALTEAELERLEAEFDNLQAALDWWLTAGRPAEGLRLAVAFHAVWSRLGQYALGRRWLEAMLDLAERMAPAGSFGLERAVALTEAGTLAGYQGDTEQARAFHRRSVDVWRALDHPPGLAIALANLGLAEWVAGDADQATVLLEEALTRSRTANVPHTVAISLRNLGLIARAQGQYARAETLFQEAAAQALPPGWFRSYSVARSLSCLGRVACLQHDLARARVLLQHAFAAIRQAGVTGQALADCLDWQAALEAQQGDLARAARLFGAADTHWRTSGAHRYAPDEATYARDLAEVRAALDDQAFAAGWAEGAAMTAEQAIAYALWELDVLAVLAP